MDTYNACTYCREPIPHHRSWCHQYAESMRKGPVSEPTSSEDSTTSDPQAQKQLHEAADSLLRCKNDGETLRSLTGMPPSEFWPTAMMAAISHMSGQLDTLGTLLTKLPSALNAPRSSGPQPAPSSPASMPADVSAASIRAASPPRFSSEETLNRV